MSGGAPPQLPKDVNSCLPPSRGEPAVLLEYEMLPLGVLLVLLMAALAHETDVGLAENLNSSTPPARAAIFPDDVDVDDGAESVVRVLKSPVGIPQQVELPAKVIVLVGELHAILPFPEN